jgi:amino acid adenylation domain-containing protein
MLRLDPSDLSALDFDPFAGPELALTAPATESQREIWAAARMGADASCAFNESSSLRFVGRLDIETLSAALKDLVQRHEALRTTFSPDGASLLVAVEFAVSLDVEDLADLDVAARQARADRIRTEEVETAFDLEQGPLLRTRLVRLAANHHILILTAHHSICDGWSTGVLLRELAALYSARRASTDVSLPPPNPFSAYAFKELARAGSEEDLGDERHWVAQFAGHVPVLELPTDGPRPPLRSYHSARVDRTLDTALVTGLKAIARSASASFFSTLLSGFDVLLNRLTGQDDLIVGIATAGQLGTGMTDVVGHCVNTLPIRAHVDPDASFRSLLGQVRTSMLDATEHQLYTFGRLLQQLPLMRDPARAPLVSILFNLDSGIPDEALCFEGLETHFESNPRSYENFELFVNTVEQDGCLSIECQYNTDLFSAETVTRWLESYEVLLRSIVANPDQAVGALPVLSSTEQALLDGVNATHADYPRDACTYQLVERQCRLTPDAIAVDFHGVALTYAELDGRSNQLAHRLRSLGAGPEVLVGLCLERSLDSLVAMLAIHKAGAAYVPIDPAYPAERVGFMLSDSRLPLLVTQATLVDRLPAHDAQVLCLDADFDIAAIAAESDAALDPLARPDNLAYVIYTSGSTGKPKGVQIAHRALLNFLIGMRREPGLGPGDILVAVTTLSFDIAGLELWLPLIAGARIVLASRDTAGDGPALRATLEASRATAMQATPSTWRLLIEAGWQGGAHFKVMCGGEALAPDLAHALVARSGSAWNMYGPTETTIWSTCERLESSLERVLIGHPIANTTVHVLDAGLHHVPVGAVGELFIGGDGLARGYLGRPDLTAERFIADPCGEHGQRLYRTGDLVRLHSDGRLEYLGRNDNQVKVRGHRIELGEIEASLAQHPSVSQAVAVAREDRPGDVRLVGYVLQSAPPETAESDLRDWVRRSLPDYMVPQHIVTLQALPRTPNGKVDRRALPEPLVDSRHDTYEAPTTEAEQLVAQLWQATLHVGRIGRHDDFFALGGHSLLAAQLMARLDREHGITVPLRRIFEAPTVAQFALLLVDKGLPSERIPRRKNDTPAPLSLMQQRLWFVEQLDPFTCLYNLPAAGRITGQLDINALERAFDYLALRHESIRTTIKTGDDAATQSIAPVVHLPLTPVEDLRVLPGEQREQVLMKRLIELSEEPFDLTAGPLMRARLFRMAEEEHVLFFMPHHIIWDGWSFDIFHRELAATYDAFRLGHTPGLPELPICYTDFAAWQRQWLRGAEMERLTGYWKQQLAGDLEPLELPTDRPRPAVQSSAGGTEWFTIPRQEVEKLTKLGHAQGATLFMVLVAAYQTLLQRWSGQNDIRVGTPVRARSLPEVQDIIGLYVNAIVLRTQFEPNLTFRQLLERVRATTLDAFSHQDMPFEVLVKELDIPRDLSRTPIYQAFFSFQDARARDPGFGNCAYHQVHVLPPSAATDLSFWVMDTQDGLAGGLNYSSDLFDGPTATRFLNEYRTLLFSAIANPDQPLKELAILPEDEQRRLDELNATTRDYPQRISAYQLVVDQAVRTPEAIAAEFEGHTLTYRELDTQSNQLAHRLRSLGVSHDALVGVCVDRSLDMLVALLAVHKAGGAYVPLDPGFPPERLAFMADDAGLKVLITQERLQDLIPNHHAEVICTDSHRASIERESTTPLESLGTPDDLAYVIYTSGSTGKPKGVEVSQGALLNFLWSMREEPGLGADDVLVAVTTLSFDIAGLELWLPLMVGARVVIASREVAADGEQLRALLDHGHATVMQATPTTWRLILAAGWRGGSHFKAICGGEALPVDLARELAACCASAWNLYGPTETTIWSTLWRVPAAIDAVRIGRPIANTTVYILDDYLQQQPIGVPGEMYIGGDGLAHGYLNRADLTAERFVPNPFGPTGRRLYKTGDRARWRTDGNLEFLGRDDFQVKIRGYRVELAEIETTLAQHPAVAQAVASVREDLPGGARLVAYLVPSADVDYTASELRKHLRASLPEYMIPQHFVELESLPLTPNGKVNRKALPTPFQMPLATGPSRVMPRTRQEQLVVEIWESTLGTSGIGVHDNFFHLGGHSVLCLQVIGQIERRTGLRLSPRVILLNSLEQVASLLPAAA